MFFQGLRLPGDFLTIPPPAYLPLTQGILSQIKAFPASLRPTPTRVVQSRPMYIPLELETCSHFFIKVDPTKPNLTPTYAGPYPVVLQTEKTFEILHDDKLQQVAINNVKPSFPLQSPENIAVKSSIFSLPSSQNDAISTSIAYTKPSSTNNDKTSDHGKLAENVSLRNSTISSSFSYFFSIFSLVTNVSSTSILLAEDTSSYR